jgi:hypothetical protein
LEEKSKLAQAQVNKPKHPPAIKSLNERKSKLHPPHYDKDMQSLKRKRGPSSRNIDSVKAFQPAATRSPFTQPTSKRNAVGAQADLQTYQRHERAQSPTVGPPGSEGSKLFQPQSHQAVQVVASRTKASDNFASGSSVG